MKNDEIEELISEMDAKGWRTMECDGLIDYYDNPVNCGVPMDVGDVGYTQVPYPHELLPGHSVFRVAAKGDSMKDAGIEEGDWLTVETGTRISDDDIVIAFIDGDFTVKAYYVDDENRKWLIPYNEKYEPILLEGGVNYKIVGKVIEVSKQHPRVKNRISKRILSKMQDVKSGTKTLTYEEKQEIIRSVAPMVTIARQWYAVYRALLDYKQIEKRNYVVFCDMVTKAVPEHDKKPATQELQRMEVQSFAKPVVLWNEEDAPVQGSRYNSYKAIADKTLELIREMVS